MKQLTATAMETFRVLLVEDNTDDEFLAVWALNKVGIKLVSVARDGREALDMIYGVGGTADSVPDLIILDLCLPKMGGIEVLQRLREDTRTQELPVLIISSSEDPGDRNFCRRHGIIDFISKPLQAADLIKILNITGNGPPLPR